MRKLKFPVGKYFTSLFLMIVISYFLVSLTHAEDIPDFNTENIGNVAPKELKSFWSGPSGQGISVLELFSTINNAILIIAVLFSIIGSVIGVIKLVTGNFSENANDAKEGRSIINNSVIAFVIAVSIYFILRLILNTIGASEIEKVVNPTTPAPATTTP